MALPKVCTYSLKTEFDKTERCLMAFHCAHAETVSLLPLAKTNSSLSPLFKAQCGGYCKIQKITASYFKGHKAREGKSSDSSNYINLRPGKQNQASIL